MTGDYMKPIITVDPKIDKTLDKHFSKKSIKTIKLINSEKILTKIISEAQHHHEQFIPKNANSYNAGFDNGYSLGFYAGLVKASKIIIDKKF